MGSCASRHRSRSHTCMPKQCAHAGMHNPSVHCHEPLQLPLCSKLALLHKQPTIISTSTQGAPAGMSMSDCAALPQCRPALIKRGSKICGQGEDWRQVALDCGIAVYPQKRFPFCQVPCSQLDPVESIPECSTIIQLAMPSHACDQRQGHGQGPGSHLPSSL